MDTLGKNTFQDGVLCINAILRHGADMRMKMHMRNNVRKTIPISLPAQEPPTD